MTNDDKWDWGHDHNLFHNSIPKKKYLPSPPRANSPPVNPIKDMKDHNDSPVSEVTAPNSIQMVPFASYPTPLPSPDSYIVANVQTQLLVLI